MDTLVHGVLQTLMELNKRMEELVEVNRYLMNELVQRGPDHHKQALAPLWQAMGSVEASIHALEELLAVERKP